MFASTRTSGLWAVLLELSYLPVFVTKMVYFRVGYLFCFLYWFPTEFCRLRLGYSMSSTWWLGMGMGVPNGVLGHRERCWLCFWVDFILCVIFCVSSPSSSILIPLFTLNFHLFVIFNPYNIFNNKISK